MTENGKRVWLSFRCLGCEGRVDVRIGYDNEEHGSECSDHKLALCPHHDCDSVLDIKLSVIERSTTEASM